MLFIIQSSKYVEYFISPLRWCHVLAMTFSWAVKAGKVVIKIVTKPPFFKSYISVMILAPKGSFRTVARRRTQWNNLRGTPCVVSNFWARHRTVGRLRRPLSKPGANYEAAFYILSAAWEQPSRPQIKGV